MSLTEILAVLPQLSRKQRQKLTAAIANLEAEEAGEAATAELLAIPGMLESIREAQAVPTDKMATELPW